MHTTQLMGLHSLSDAAGATITAPDLTVLHEVLSDELLQITLLPAHDATCELRQTLRFADADHMARWLVRFLAHQAYVSGVTARHATAHPGESFDEYVARLRTLRELAQHARVAFAQMGSSEVPLAAGQQELDRHTGELHDLWCPVESFRY